MSLRRAPKTTLQLCVNLGERGTTMKRILLLAVVLTLAFGSSAARIEMREASDSGSGVNAQDVEGAGIRGDRAYAAKGYEFVQVSRSSFAVIKIVRNVRRQTGTLNCVSSENHAACYTYISRYKREAECGCTDGRYRFIGVPGGPPMAPPS